MQGPALYRLGRLKGIQHLLGFLLVSRTRTSMMLFTVIDCEIDEMITEWETELDLEVRILAKSQSSIQEASVDEAPPFDDCDRVVEHRMPPEPQVRPTYPGAPMETGSR
jgi:hypothetical protein